MANVSEDQRHALLERVKAEFFRPHLVGNHYEVQQVIGEGSYGVVCSAIELQTKTMVAVKRITNIFDDIPEAVRTLRELKFLRLLKDHENIVTIRDVLLPSDERNFNDVFVVLEIMPTDLTRVLRSRIALSPEHVRWLAYQLLRGVHHIHSAKVYHRDLKPSNILINAMCDLRICDFGLARAARDDGEDNDAVFWTDYVATRWYRAPELIMTAFTHYTTAIDMWSLGCILAEMFNDGRPLFPGVNAIDQLEKIVDVTGTPSAEVVHAEVRNPRAREHLLAMPRRPRRPLAEVLTKNEDPEAMSLLETILQFDPTSRPSAAQALDHPYFVSLHDPSVLASSEADAIPLKEFAFEKQRLSIESIRALFLEEILKYHPSRRDDYLNPGGGGSLRFDQAGRFGDAMRARENGLAAPPPHASMPTEQMGGMINEVAGAFGARNSATGSEQGPSGNSAGIAPGISAPAFLGSHDSMEGIQASYVTAPAVRSSSEDIRHDEVLPDAPRGRHEEDQLMPLQVAHERLSATAEVSGPGNVC